MSTKLYPQKYKVQIPFQKEMGEQVEAIAEEIGFDSIGALTRFFYLISQRNT